MDRKINRESSIHHYADQIGVILGGTFLLQPFVLSYVRPHLYQLEEHFNDAFRDFTTLGAAYLTSASLSFLLSNHLMSKIYQKRFSDLMGSMSPEVREPPLFFSSPGQANLEKAKSSAHTPMQKIAYKARQAGHQIHASLAKAPFIWASAGATAMCAPKIARAVEEFQMLAAEPDNPVHLQSGLEYLCTPIITAALGGLVLKEATDYMPMEDPRLCLELMLPKTIKNILHIKDSLETKALAAPGDIRQLMYRGDYAHALEQLAQFYAVVPRLKSLSKDPLTSRNRTGLQNLILRYRQYLSDPDSLSAQMNLLPLAAVHAKDGYALADHISRSLLEHPEIGDLHISLLSHNAQLAALREGPHSQTALEYLKAYYHALQQLPDTTIDPAHELSPKIRIISNPRGYTPWFHLLEKQFDTLDEAVAQAEMAEEIQRVLGKYRHFTTERVLEAREQDGQGIVVLAREVGETLYNLDQSPKHIPPIILLGAIHMMSLLHNQLPHSEYWRTSTGQRVLDKLGKGKNAIDLKDDGLLIETFDDDRGSYRELRDRYFDGSYVRGLDFRPKNLFLTPQDTICKIDCEQKGQYPWLYDFVNFVDYDWTIEDPLQSELLKEAVSMRRDTGHSDDVSLQHPYRSYLFAKIHRNLELALLGVQPGKGGFTTIPNIERIFMEGHTEAHIFWELTKDPLEKEYLANVQTIYALLDPFYETLTGKTYPKS